jgi:hypothetical protein
MYNMRKPMYAFVVIVTALVAGQVSATPAWYEVTFTGADMFNYTSGIAPYASQNAPRRFRAYDDNYGITSELTTNAGSGGVSDFQNWATGNLASFEFAQFNLWGDSIPDPYVPATSWDQPYRAVPDNGDGTFGANSWRLVQSPTGWAAGSGIVLANQGYNPMAYAWPVWRAPTGGEITSANAAGMVFTFDVLIENPESAFGPDGKLRVWFGGQNLVDSIPGAYNEVAGIMELDARYIPAPSALLLVGIGSSLVTWLRKRSTI